MEKKHTPPQWMDHLLEWFCDTRLWEGIRGDLEELFAEHVESKGLRRARLLYLVQGVGFLRLTFTHKSKKLTPMSSFWQNYFHTIFRSILRQKVLFGINLVGLTLAISCLLFAWVYIYDEYQADKQLASSHCPHESV